MYGVVAVSAFDRCEVEAKAPVRTITYNIIDFWRGATGFSAVVCAKNSSTSDGKCCEHDSNNIEHSDG